MLGFMIGRKAGMTQIFAEDGSVIPVTVIECEPMTLVQKKTEDRDGYKALRFGYGETKKSRVNRPDAGQFKKAGVEPLKLLREFRTEEIDAYELGQVLTAADAFETGTHVDVSGVSKGKGFAGNIKRHNQKGGREAHGSKYHRRVGSMGSSATPSRVMKGKKMPGHLGAANVTVQNLEIVLVDAERNLMAIKGALPGPRGAVLEIRTSVKSKK